MHCLSRGRGGGVLSLIARGRSRVCRRPAGSAPAAIAMAALLAAVAVSTAGEPAGDRGGNRVFVSPYDDVPWERIGYYDANLHTHTNYSDGRYDPHYAIDRYHDLGYRILALTDHDSLHFQYRPESLYPWTELNAIYHEIKDETNPRFDQTFRELVDEEWQNRDPNELGMVSVPGSEISRTHHIGSLFNRYASGTRSEETAFVEIANRGGLAMFYHPGRYDRPDEWYIDYFQRHDHVVGMEVYNQVDRYPVDRARWDSVLHRLMPGRPVWGFANDDTHTDNHFGRNRNVFMLSELSEQAVFDAMKSGHFFFFVPADQGTAPPLRLRGATVGDRTLGLEIEGDFERIEWITHNTETGESETVGTGKTVSMDEIFPEATFVRAVIVCGKGRTYTQPFGIESR